MAQIERTLTDGSRDYTGTSAISETGSIIAVSERGGSLNLIRGSRIVRRLSAPTRRSISHIHVSEEGPKGVIASMDGGVIVGFNDQTTWEHQLEGLWDIQPVNEMTGVCACTRPRVGTGGVYYFDGPERKWKESLNESVGIRVAASSDGSQIVVAKGKYESDEEPLKRFGESGVDFYEWGEKEWSKETQVDAIGIVLDSENNRIIAGLDDGSIAGYTSAGDLFSKEDGIFKVSDEIWSRAQQGGFLSVSGDQTSILSHVIGVLRCFDTRGNLQWKSDIEGMSMDERTVEVDHTGSRALVTTMDEHAYLVEEGELLWEESYPGGPVRGSLSGDGSTWCITDDNLEAQDTAIHIYQDTEYGG